MPPLIATVPQKKGLTANAFVCIMLTGGSSNNTYVNSNMQTKSGYNSLTAGVISTATSTPFTIRGAISGDSGTVIRYNIACVAEEVSAIVTALQFGLSANSTSTATTKSSATFKILGKTYIGTLSCVGLYATFNLVRQ